MSEPKRYWMDDQNDADFPYEAVDGEWVKWEDYAKLDAEKWRWANRETVERLEKLETINELLQSVVNRFFNASDLKNQPDAQSYYALAENLKQLPDSILDFTEEQVRDNPAWALAVFRHKVKEMQYKRCHDLNQMGGQCEEIARLKAEVERLTFDPMSYLDDQGEWMPRHTHLAAVARLKAEAVTKDYLITQLKAEVERLRKHGDAMAEALEAAGFNNARDFWNAAKEGKPQP